MSFCILIFHNGAGGIRTLGLLNAIQTRSQLRYSPPLIFSISFTPAIVNQKTQLDVIPQSLVVVAGFSLRRTTQPKGYAYQFPPVTEGLQFP